jgi:hypothetical protein
MITPANLYLVDHRFGGGLIENSSRSFVAETRAIGNVASRFSPNLLDYCIRFLR